MFPSNGTSNEVLGTDTYPKSILGGDLLVLRRVDGTVPTALVYVKCPIA